jgi:hypothetical protein
MSGSDSKLLDQTVTQLIPSLSRSLAEQFNVFRVMHHGTYEKQLSNVFTWLLRPDATHHLGGRFQQIFLARVNEGLPAGAKLPPSGYDHVAQEVDTVGDPALGKKDIADIVLTRSDARVVIENYGTSDGHDHVYTNYRDYGMQDGRRAAVVLLCIRHDKNRQEQSGWRDAVVTTYETLLGDLRALVAEDRSWREANRKQSFFLDQLFDHFLEGPSAMSLDDRLAFLKTMCETGESARYGYRPQDSASEEFANLIAQHARQQFDDGRKVLGEIKRALQSYATHTLTKQLNDLWSTGQVTRVDARYQGKWEWCVVFRRADAQPNLFITFGPTAVAENDQVTEPLVAPDYSRVFVGRQAAEGDAVEQHEQTEVGLAEILAGLPADDTRLRDAFVELLARV